MLCPVNTEIRPATGADYTSLGEIAGEGGASGIEPRYLSFVAASGQLLVASRDRRPVAFAGMVPVGEVAMVTDLFVASSHRGQGVGGVVLHELLQGWSQRMTHSSQHPAALPAYRREGMTPQWRLLYLHGAAIGGGAPLQPAPWAGGRGALVEYFAAGGAVVTEDSVVCISGEGAVVQRQQHPRAADRMAAVLAALPEGLSVHAFVPEPHPLAEWMLHNGFIASDHDVFCASAGVEFPGDVSCVHPGLA